ncbi:MAG TPA: SIMPL domain-containing protein [Candidatus Dormibacteraeota bacterium]|jgi:hypothetical protein|nr:SIMPL domain-containing protein [Candidatus Dormibacteraeota bacterium]
MPRRLLWILPFAALAALVLITRPGQGGLAPTSLAASPLPSGSENPVITAVGTGQVKGQPDLLTLVLGVTTRAASSQAALKDNANRANALIDTLKSHGVAAQDISTDQLNINPTYTNDGRSITGYEVSNLVSARLHDISRAGSVIDAAAGAAGDAIRVQQISFGFDDNSALLAAARSDGVRRAHDQADQMARAAGTKLGKVRSISEASSSQPDQYAPKAYSGAAAGAPTPILPGLQQLTVTVTVVYDIEQ